MGIEPKKMNLTEDDKNWILERLERVETTLLTEFHKWGSTQLEAVETRMAERLERVETTLLTEFHKWASPAEMRARTHAAAIRTLDLEMESVTERLKKLEDDRKAS